MYFPYLRGRQNELLAVRELVERGKLSPLVVPIIEPVKLSSTLTSTIDACDKKGHSVCLIANPQVGSFYDDIKKEASGEKLQTLQKKCLNSTSIITALITTKGVDEHLKMLKTLGLQVDEMLSLYLDRDYIDCYDTLFEKKGKYNVVPYDPAYRRIRGTRILIADRFAPIKKERNNDYLKKEDEFFSDDHCFFLDDNYYGFSDYSIVGQDYQESGFAPYAVAIHIVYLDEQNNLRIHHFVSDSNDDINDPANKFYEAVEKLVKWNKEKKLNTLGIENFERLYETGAYPGLGVVKKLSIMHHLEYMGKFLEEQKK